MLIEGLRTLLVRCSCCGKLKEYKFNLFEAMKYDKIEYECSCGHINSIIIRKNKRNHYFNYEDIYCELSFNTILRDNNIFRSYNDSRILFLGNKEMGRKKLVESGIDIADIPKERTEKKYLNKFSILTKALIKLYDLDKNNNIICECGNSNIKIELFFDRIELKCPICNITKFVFVNKEEDLNILLGKERIVLNESNISCIDSILEKDKHIKK